MDISTSTFEGSAHGREHELPLVRKFKTWLAQSIWAGTAQRHRGSDMNCPRGNSTCDLSLSVLDSEPDFNRVPGETPGNPCLEVMQTGVESGVVGELHDNDPTLQFPQFQDTVNKLETPKLITSQITSHLKFRANSSHGLRKRLNAVAEKKEAEIKQIKRFITELNQWSVNPLFQNDKNDTQMVIEQISILFSQDIIYQTCVAKQVRDIARNLEYISLKESELVSDHKRLIQTHKHYSSIKVRKGEEHPETNFSLERLLAAEHSYMILKNSFQKTISITMREMFQNLSYEYYSNSEDMKQVSSDLIRDFMTSLEGSNFHKFHNQLDNIRRRRTEKKWSQFSPEERKNPAKWENIKSGIYEKDDTLLQNIYQNVPNICSTNALFQKSANEPDVQSFGDDENDFTTTSNDKAEDSPDLNSNKQDGSGNSDKYDPITTNTFFTREDKVDEEEPLPILQERNLNNEKTVKPDPLNLEGSATAYSSLKPSTPDRTKRFTMENSAGFLCSINTNLENSARTENLESNNWSSSVL